MVFDVARTMRLPTRGWPRPLRLAEPAGSRSGQASGSAGLGVCEISLSGGLMAAKARRSAGRRRGPTQKSLETRERILGTATELFAKKGYHATGVAELSEAVGLGAGAFYHHIGAKEELLFTICRGHIEEVLAVGEELLLADLPATEKLRLLARKHMQNVAERTLELRVTLREIESLTGRRRKAMQALRDRAEEIWEQIAEEGRQSGELEGLDSLFVKAALGALNYSVLWYRPKGALTPDEIADRTIDLMLGSARADRRLLSSSARSRMQADGNRRRG
jgi:TetR/AcrR family transcriptional regulator, cholesterol catabolism regulator